MEDKKFKVIIVEDVKLELKGTEEIFRHEIPNAEVIGTAMTENEFWPLMETPAYRDLSRRYVSKSISKYAKATRSSSSKTLNFASGWPRQKQTLPMPPQDGKPPR